MSKPCTPKKHAKDTLSMLGSIASGYADMSTSETYKPVFTAAANALNDLGRNAAKADPNPVLDDGVRRAFYLRSIVEPIATAARTAEHDADFKSMRRLDMLGDAIKDHNLAGAVHTLRDHSPAP